MANASITARKKLSALFSRGCAVRFTRDGVQIAQHEEPPGSGTFVFTDEDGELPEDGVELWVAPPNPHHREMSLREAQASRARALLRVKNNPESEEYLTVRAYLVDLSLDDLIEYLLMSDSDARLNEAMRLVLAQKEWENFDELRDAMRQYQEAVDRYDETGEGEDPRDAEEWTDLLAADARYAVQVGEQDEELAEAARAGLRMVGRDELERRAADKRAEIAGSQAFMAEYEDQMRFYSTRTPEDHNRLFFESVQEMREADQIVQNGIREALRMFITDGTEAKN